MHAKQCLAAPQKSLIRSFSRARHGHAPCLPWAQPDRLGRKGHPHTGARLLLQLHRSKCHTAAQGMLSPVGPRLGGLSCRHTECSRPNGRDDTVKPKCKAAPSPGTTREWQPSRPSVACSWTPWEPKPTGVGLATDTWSSQAELGSPETSDQQSSSPILHLLCSHAHHFPYAQEGHWECCRGRGFARLLLSTK